MWGWLLIPLVFLVVVGLWWRANRGRGVGNLDVNAKNLAERRQHWGPR
jgi:hypothetical protein